MVQKFLKGIVNELQTQGMKLFRVAAIFSLSLLTSQIKICLDEGIPI